MLLAASRCCHPAPRGLTAMVSPSFMASTRWLLHKLTQLPVILKRTELTGVCLVAVIAAEDLVLWKLSASD